MEYNVSDLVQEVRVAMDENRATGGVMTSDTNTLTLEEIIESKLPMAARVVESTAPALLLDSGKAFGETIIWESHPGYGSGHIQLPDDFLRLVTFQMSDWEQAVTEAIDESDPLYAMQRSRYPGIRGNPRRPVVAIVHQPIGLVLEFYACESGDQAYIKRARYIAEPKVVDGKIELCAQLKAAVVLHTAYLTALAIKDTEMAQALSLAEKELIGIVYNDE